MSSSPFSFVSQSPLFKTRPAFAPVLTSLRLRMSHVQVGEHDNLRVSEQNMTPLLSLSQVVENLKIAMEPKRSNYRAMYSSVVGGITTDPAAMVIPIDDHMVHRGHGVFDTAIIADGYLYELDGHLDRILKSAAMAKISLPYERSILRKILIETVAASGCKLGNLRYWLSAGPGGFGLSSSECPRSAFYAIVLESNGFSESAEGAKVITSTVAVKPPEFATMKNVNYLPNALSLLQAEECGAYTAIWLDSEGFVAEGPNLNVAFVTEARELLIPSFDTVLSGCTARRMIALAPKLLAPNTEKGDPESAGLLSKITVGKIKVEQGKASREMMLIGSSLPILPVVKWDDQQIGDGEPGPVTLALRNLLIEDMRHGPVTLRVPVPY